LAGVNRPNEIWQADHTPLDLWVSDGNGNAVRHRVSILLQKVNKFKTLPSYSIPPIPSHVAFKSLCNL